MSGVPSDRATVIAALADRQPLRVVGGHGRLIRSLLRRLALDVANQNPRHPQPLEHDTRPLEHEFSLALSEPEAVLGQVR
jgi:hypothetical protein